MELWALLLLLGVAGLVYLLVQDYLERKRCKIPGPKPLPLLGNTIESLQKFDRILDWHYENTLKYGDTWTFTVIGQPRRIMTSNPLNIEHILKKNFENYEKGVAFKERMHDFLGDGIFNVDGDQWKDQRKTASNIFNVKNFRDNMCHVFVKHGKEVLKLLDELKPGEAINMHDLFHRYTLDSIGEIAFGIEIGSVRDSSVPFARAFDYCQSIVFKRFTSPIWKLRKMFSSDEKKFRESLKILNEFCEKTVRERKLENNGELDRSDLLSLFMNKKNSDGVATTDKFLRDMMLNFVIAGRDTTANLLSWCFYEIAQRKEVEDNLIEEIDSIFGGEDPNYEVKGMKYTTAFVSEAIRLHPSVPKDPKYVVEDDVLPDGTQVTAGSWVVYLPYTMGRLEKLWGKDALEFKPERFFEDQKPSPFKFSAFQAGPRTCLGQDMAYIETKVLLSMILQKYRLRLVPGQNIDYQNNITLPMRNFSMMMYAEKRED